MNTIGNRAPYILIIILAMLLLCLVADSAGAQSLIHCYALIELDENVPMDAVRAAWPYVRRGVGRQFSEIPSEITHYRIRPDHRAIILEALVDESELSAFFLYRVLAEATGYSTTQIETHVSIQGFNCGAGYSASRAAAAEYLRENAAEWELGE